MAKDNMKISMLFVVSVLLFASSSDCAIRFNTDCKLNSSKFKKLYFKQVLDHYSLEPLGYKLFNQRVFIDDSRWSHSAHNNISRPIVAYLGAEQTAEDQLCDDSFIYSIADHFNALFVFIEHRYYGESMPFGSAALDNPTTRAFLTVPQALHDYATVIVDVKRKYSAQQSPVIVIGASYGGVLSTFFRLKYPHIATAALSSSAPILYHTRTSSVDSFYEITTKDYKDAGCDKYIKNSWDKLYKEALKPSGLKNLQKLFGLSELSSYGDLEQGLIDYYEHQAQYDYSKVQEICKIIMTDKRETNLLKRIANAVVPDLNEFMYQAQTPMLLSYAFQISTQILQRFNRNPKTTMFPRFQYSFKDNEKECLLSYEVEPRPELLGIEFGFMSDIKIMKDIGSNIIFSNGLRDPFSRGGILESISETLVALKSKDATHCMDINLPSLSDPESLKQMRAKELQILQKWIEAYHSNA